MIPMSFISKSIELMAPHLKDNNSDTTESKIVCWMLGIIGAILVITFVGKIRIYYNQIRLEKRRVNNVLTL